MLQYATVRPHFRRCQLWPELNAALAHGSSPRPIPRYGGSPAGPLGADQNQKISICPRACARCSRCSTQPPLRDSQFPMHSSPAYGTWNVTQLSRRKEDKQA